MLYVTTRSKRDAYTPHRVLSLTRGEDGGLYIPMRDPEFSDAQLNELCQKGFNHCVAQILNLQFNTKLTSWDVDFAVGRHPVRLKKLNQRVVMGELWHNTGWKFSGMVDSLMQCIRKDSTGAVSEDWAVIGVRIAVLFGIYTELNRAGLASTEQPFDVSVVSGDFSGAMSAWYARKWGLPIGNIVCCCNENNDIWNLFCHGQLRTDSVVKNTDTPDADVAIPESLERLICAVGGYEAVEDYLFCLRRGLTYYPEEYLLRKMRSGLHISVVSQPRIKQTIPNVYSGTGYVLSPYDALSFAGLLDYRSRTGASAYAVVLSEKAPGCDLRYVAEALKITTEELKVYFNKQ